MTEVRSLQPGDEAALDRFLARHPATTMFFRTNLAAVGPVDGRARHQGHDVGAFDGPELVGLAAHDWNGNLVMEVPQALPEVVRAAVSGSGWRCGAWSGPTGRWWRRGVLGMEDAPTTLDDPEILYALELDTLRIPEAQRSGTVRCRRAEGGDLDALVPWRVAYRAELGDGVDTPAEHAAPRVMLRSWLRERRVGPRGGGAIGGDGAVQRRPARRGVGRRGVHAADGPGAGPRAGCGGGGAPGRPRGGGGGPVLFTGRDNVGAQRAYEALGFEAGGDDSLVSCRRGG